MKLVDQVAPDGTIDLASMSHVKVSFEVPDIGQRSQLWGPCGVLEIIRTNHSHARFYQASTSELFGKVRETPQD